MTDEIVSVGPNWTKEQLQAIKRHKGNLLVAAAAGSGKTAVLVERILRKISDEESPCDIDSFLVVTFTNAAASEMKEKIEAAIARALDKSPENKRLHRQLSLLGRASITTIHSFCLKVIKSNIHLLNIDPSFKMADNTEIILLKQEAINELFDKKYEEHPEEFLKLVECYSSERDDIRLQEIILEIYNFVMSGPWPEIWLKDAAEAFNMDESTIIENTKWYYIFYESFKIQINSFIKRLEEGISLTEDGFGLMPYRETLIDDLDKLQDFLNVDKRSYENLYKKASTLKLINLKRCPKDADKIIGERVKYIRDEVKVELSKLLNESFQHTKEGIIEYTATMYPVIKCLVELVIEFEATYARLKRDRNILDFNDLEHFCLEILTEVQEGEPIPSKVAVLYSEKFNEILVDEYQDSNQVQDVIFSMISRKGSNSNMFMVGDVKQSIYKFRQAEPAIFLNKYFSYDNVEEEKDSFNEKILLFKNFRSRHEIINGVNYLFSRLMSPEIGEIDYNQDEELNYGADFKELEEGNTLSVGGPIELHLIEKEKIVTEAIEEEDIQEEEQVDNIQLEARFIGKRIKELITEGFQIYDKNQKKYRKLQYRDIVILLRATKRWSESFMEELKLLAIPVYSDGATGYFETIEVKTVISLLQIIDNPLQDIPLLAVLHSPIFSFTPGELIDMRALNRDMSFYNLLQLGRNESEKIDQFLTKLEGYREKAKYMPIDELIWYIYADTAYMGYVSAMPSGLQRRANLRILFQRAKQFEETSYKGLFNFINFIERLKKSSTDLGSAKILGENENLVRIMSIHKSKGLEFPVVFLSGIGKNFNKSDSKGKILLHKTIGIGADFVDLVKRITHSTIIKNTIKKKIMVENLSEELRVLYVAMTRAKEKLIITGAVKDIESSIERWEGTLEEKGKLSTFDMLKGRSYLDWICFALIRHKAFETFLKEIRGEALDVNSKACDNTWQISLWSKNQLVIDKVVANEENIHSKDMESFIKELLNNKKEIDYKNVHEMLNWEYKYKAAITIAPKISISELKRRKEEEVTPGKELYKDNRFERPRFILKSENGGKQFTAAERGTLFHLVMQHIDIKFCENMEDIKLQVNAMVEKELMSKEEMNLINIDKIYNYFTTNIGKRLRASEKTFREVPFYIPIKLTELEKDLDVHIYGKEFILLQGIIDCYFEEEDGLILIDYKTDHVNEENIKEVVERYTIQIDYYTMALERITGKKVKEKYLYFFSLNVFQIIK
ncbi:MAG TPA: helicase-exonuclease AddAB subunit AddA [Clostridiaceae bacterium]